MSPNHLRSSLVGLELPENSRPPLQYFGAPIRFQSLADRKTSTNEGMVSFSAPGSGAGLFQVADLCAVLSWFGPSGCASAGRAKIINRMTAGPLPITIVIERPRVMLAR